MSCDNAFQNTGVQYNSRPLVVGARCPYVGVAGSTLSGGLSWLSHELGLASDPQNLLDVQMVITDGRVVWASEDPELLWALRGGGGNFGGKCVHAFYRLLPTLVLSAFSVFPTLADTFPSCDCFASTCS